MVNIKELCNFILFKISRDEATSAHQRFLRRNPDGLLNKEDFIEEATVRERELS